ncbi:MAG: VWA domain-containing protein, partial [Pseudomonadota bacterium]
MKTLTARIAGKLKSNRTGLAVFVVLSVLTALALAAPFGRMPLPVKTVTGHVTPAAGAVTLSGKLSQTKLVQGGNGIVYLDVTITAPPVENVTGTRPATDMVIVLDRSGSMAEANKMPYAKAAIQDVLARLGDEDRFALVSFSDAAQTHGGLTYATAANKERLSAMVAEIGPGGGTNMGEGLSTAFSLLATDGMNRTRKALLLSDGLANQGVTDPGSLAQIAGRFATREAVLSTIGMGLGFN